MLLVCFSLYIIASYCHYFDTDEENEEQKKYEAQFILEAKTFVDQGVDYRKVRDRKAKDVSVQVARTNRISPTNDDWDLKG